MSIEINLDKLEKNFEIPLYLLESQLQREIKKENKFEYSEIEIKDASASIYYTENNYNLLIAIYGPKETKFKEKIKPNKANIEVYTKFNIDIPKEDNFTINNQIKKYLKNIILTTSYPKCQINANINILNYSGKEQNNYKLYSTIFNGLSFCLCLSGIDMKALALSKSITKESKSVLITLDANDEERLLSIESDKPLKLIEYDDIIEKVKKENEMLYKEIKKILYDKLKII